MSTTIISRGLGCSVVELSRGMTRHLMPGSARKELNAKLPKLYQDAFDSAAKKYEAAAKEAAQKKVAEAVDAFNKFDPTDIRAGARVMLAKLASARAGRPHWYPILDLTKDYEERCKMTALQHVIEHGEEGVSAGLRREITHAALEHHGDLCTHLGQTETTAQASNVKAAVQKELEQGRIVIGRVKTKRGFGCTKTGKVYAQVYAPQDAEGNVFKSDLPTVKRLTGGDHAKYAAAVVEYKTEFNRLMGHRSPYISREVGVSTQNADMKPMDLLRRLKAYDQAFIAELPPADIVEYGMEKHSTLQSLAYLLSQGLVKTEIKPVAPGSSEVVMHTLWGSPFSRHPVFEIKVPHRTNQSPVEFMVQGYRKAVRVDRLLRRFNVEQAHVSIDPAILIDGRTKDVTEERLGLAEKFVEAFNSKPVRKRIEWLRHNTLAPSMRFNNYITESIQDMEVCKDGSIQINQYKMQQERKEKTYTVPLAGALHKLNSQQILEHVEKAMKLAEDIAGKNSDSASKSSV